MVNKDFQKPASTHLTICRLRQELAASELAEAKFLHSKLHDCLVSTTEIYYTHFRAVVGPKDCVNVIRNESLLEN